MFPGAAQLRHAVAAGVSPQKKFGNRLFSREAAIAKLLCCHRFTAQAVLSHHSAGSRLQRCAITATPLKTLRRVDLQGNAVKDFESFNPWPKGQVVQTCYVLAFRPRVKRLFFGAEILNGVAFRGQIDLGTPEGGTANGVVRNLSRFQLVKLSCGPA